MTTINFKNLVKSLLVLMLLANVNWGLRAQTLSSEKSRDIASRDQEQLERFEKQLDDLRTGLKIPGMSAAIVGDQQLHWAKGLGFADLEKQIPATKDTPYRIASLTKTFASTLVMQLVEEGKLDLNEPMAKYSSDFKDDSVKLRHVLTHTSQGTPGERYQYSGSRFAYLTTVIEKTSGKSFRELLVKNILDKLDMSNSVPGQDILTESDKWGVLLGKENLDRYASVLAKLAKPYRLYGANEIIPTPYPPKGISASAGLISTAVDLAKYGSAIDRHVFLKKETQEKVFTPAVSNDGKTLPYGLGWFVQNHQGLKLIWHYGYWPNSFSALILKVPEKSLTFILLANSDGLSAPFGLGAGDIMSSSFACTFMRLFVFEGLTGRRLPDPQWAQDRQEFSAELSRFRKQANGYPYDCELDAHAAIMKWLESRRAQERTAVKVDPKIYEAYVGQYEVRPNRVLTITKQRDRLIGETPGDPTVELFPESVTKFFLKTAEVQLTFVKDAKGQVTHLEVQAEGQNTRAKRIK